MQELTIAYEQGRWRIMTLEAHENKGNRRMVLSYPIPPEMLRTMFRNIVSQYDLFEIDVINGRRNLERTREDTVFSLPVRTGRFMRLLYGQRYLAFLKPKPSLFVDEHVGGYGQAYTASDGSDTPNDVYPLDLPDHALLVACERSEELFRVLGSIRNNGLRDQMDGLFFLADVTIEIDSFVTMDIDCKGNSRFIECALKDTDRYFGEPDEPVEEISTEDTAFELESEDLAIPDVPEMREIEPYEYDPDQ